MRKAIIIEDEKPAARRLKRIVEEQGFEVIVMLYSVNQAIEWFENNKHPDLIFLDIQLADGLSFDIFDNVDIKSPIIFTTAYDHYALKAFKHNSIDYLLKPIDEDELAASIKKFNSFNSNDIGLEISKLKTLLFESKSYKERFSIFMGSSIKILEVADIEIIYSNDRATYAFTQHSKNLLMEGSLEQVFEQLNPKQFFKVNRKFAINFNGISEIIAYSNSRLQIKMKNYKEEEIVVSRERVKDFKDWIN
jgi:DNA-binding LytR/AlgR family response regulator